MKQYKIQITDMALSDMEEIYNYIVEKLQAPEAAMGQYNRIADAIETLDTFPERVKLMETEEEHALGLRQMPVDNFSVFCILPYQRRAGNHYKRFVQCQRYSQAFT
ncbi:type II toxin-antitoxin system RelE/ParE family toxin [Desulfosporosinus youngiae]|uniref:Plasmid stabilization system protein n=1 Tax=Desulfosporosinus youngiae DSM 17734 TaxID=768710 RepID=H5XYX6_9FIRM|nr:plasmid stabilization system protein [Desulfosporosinus youngiae DSM 17734]